MATLISDEYRRLNQKLLAEAPGPDPAGYRWGDIVRILANNLETREILDYGCGKGALNAAFGGDVRGYDPAIPELSAAPAPSDIVVCTEVLEHVEPECVDAVLEDLARVTKHIAFVVIGTRPSPRDLPDGRNEHLTVQGMSWWRAKLGRYFTLMHAEDQGGEQCVFLLRPVGVQERTAPSSPATTPTEQRTTASIVGAPSTAAPAAKDSGSAEPPLSELEPTGPLTWNWSPPATAASELEPTGPLALAWDTVQSPVAHQPVTDSIPRASTPAASIPGASTPRDEEPAGPRAGDHRAEIASASGQGPTRAADTIGRSWDFAPTAAATEPTLTLEEPVRVFVGTEPRMWAAEQVLRHSIRRHATTPTTITSMDHSLGGTWAAWDIGRPHDQPATRTKNDKGFAVWFTEFTNFRWAIPELCGFDGRAIYMDVDMLVLGDLRELFNLPMTKPILSLAPQEASVMLLDCAAIAKLSGWPTIEEMKRNGWGIQQYMQLLTDQGAFGTLPQQWNCLDGRGYVPGVTRIIHYSDMATQPWRPYPDRLAYRSHPVPVVEDLWFREAAATRDAHAFAPPRLMRAPEPEAPTDENAQGRTVHGTFALSS